MVIALNWEARVDDYLKDLSSYMFRSFQTTQLYKSGSYITRHGMHIGKHLFSPLCEVLQSASHPHSAVCRLCSCIGTVMCTKYNDHQVQIWHAMAYSDCHEILHTHIVCQEDCVFYFHNFYYKPSA